MVPLSCLPSQYIGLCSQPSALKCLYELLGVWDTTTVLGISVTTNEEMQGQKNGEIMV